MNRRRGSRVPGRFWVQFEGVDAEPVLTRGDISVSGLYVETDRSLGGPGTVQHVMISPVNRETHIEILARVVRVLSIQDSWRGPKIAGIAMEFLPENAPKRKALEAVIRKVLAARGPSPRRAAAEQNDPANAGTARSAGSINEGDLVIRSIVLDTGWDAEQDEQVFCQLEVPATGANISLVGNVVRTTPKPGSGNAPGFFVEVRFATRAEQNEPMSDNAAEGRSIAEAMGLLLSEALQDNSEKQPEPVGEQFKGSLARVRLASFLAFVEMKQLSGTLSVRQREIHARLFFRDGRVLDAEIDGAVGSPREKLGQILTWQYGDFEFSHGAPECEDQFGVDTGALLLDLAREADGSAK